MTEFDLVCMAAEQSAFPGYFYKNVEFLCDKNIGFLLNGTFISNAIKMVCLLENLECEYKADDFKGVLVSYGNVKMIQVNMPQRETEINKSQRIYFVYKNTEEKGMKTRAYFITLKNEKGDNEIYYIAPDMKQKMISIFKEEILDERMAVIKAYEKIMDGKEII